MKIPRILLIEDDRWLAESYCSTLGDAHMVDIAASGDEAIELIDEHSYQLVIADVMLEKGLVFDLLHELQSYTDTAELPVILCSALGSRLAPDDLAAYGVVDVLEKATLTPADLRVAVQRALNRIAL